MREIKIKYLAIAILLLAAFSPAAAQTAGSGGGQGVIERFIPGAAAGASEPVLFKPRYSFAYKEGAGEKLSTWIVLTDKEPSPALWAAADPGAARTEWCGKEKASFVAVKLDAKEAVDLYFLCPGNGAVNTEMVSTANGLDSIVVKLENKTGLRLKGSITGGDGSCPGEDGVNRYCTQRSDYWFDAAVVK